MDNPKVEVRETGKYGKSLFASEGISKGEVIADWSGGRIYKAAKTTDLPNDPPYFVQKHAMQFSEDSYIDYDGIGRYFSHSCEPNCGLRGKFQIVAMRDVKKDEELTFAYEMSEDSDTRIKCLCGSVSCRKNIGAFRNLPTNIRRKYKNYISSWLIEKYHLKNN